jgi:hypothetical protein
VRLRSFQQPPDQLPVPVVQASQRVEAVGNLPRGKVGEVEVEQLQQQRQGW